MNKDDERAREPGDGVLPGPALGGDTVRDTTAGHPPGHSGGTGVNEGGVPTPEVQLIADEQRLAREFARWGGRFHEVPDERFDQIGQELHVPLPIAAIARGIIEQGYYAHLNPITVPTSLTRL